MEKNNKNILILIVLIILLPTIVFAHKGRTDSNGGHYDRSTGEYHYHHGYGPHQHPNGICPYDYPSNYTSTSVNNNDSSTYNNNTITNNTVKSIVDDLYTGKPTDYNKSNQSTTTSVTTQKNTNLFSFISEHFNLILVILFISLGIIDAIIDFIKNKSRQSSKKNIIQNSTSAVQQSSHIGYKGYYSCPKCGQETNLEWDFCKYCGNKLN